MQQRIPSPLSLLEGWNVSVDGGGFAPCRVPGLVSDPCRMNQGPVIYRNRVTLPQGGWDRCTLLLKGARFCPTVRINGRDVCRREGGMGQLWCPLDSPDVKPGSTVLLEIVLLSLEDVPLQDASRIPEADWWRSNLSSLLWDEPVLFFSKGAALTQAIAFSDFSHNRLELRCLFSRCGEQQAFPVQALILDGERVVAQMQDTVYCPVGEMVQKTLSLDLGEGCHPWSPDHPQCYTVCIRYGAPEETVEGEYRFTWGKRDFHIEGKGFVLNGRPVTMRACTVVWHRFLRDPEGRELAFDQNWFLENILLRIKGHGGNGIRFHLGPPPEAFLDLCDRYGVLVQLEWSFFHGMKAGYDSLVCQWREFFLTALRHPSVVLLHLWNETEGDELQRGFAAIKEAEQGLPPLILAHRDVTHIHKYWWSLFENVGVYYHSAEQFDTPIMVDEFGGNYLDGQCRPGKYPSVQESFLRFLGRGYTAEDTLELHTQSNARVAEYWRRIGAAGFSPFCALGSPEDGNHHFLGPLRFGIPKPVWDATTAAWAPVSLSLAVWDRNYLTGSLVSMPVYLFQQTDQTRTMTICYCVTGEYDHQPVGEKKRLQITLPPDSREVQWIRFSIPERPGRYRFRGWLEEDQPGVCHPVVSQWRFRAMEQASSDALDGVSAAIVGEDEELAGFLRRHGAAVTELDSGKTVDVVVVAPGKSHGWTDADRQRLAQTNPFIPVVFLQLGPQLLGQGYYAPGQMGNLQGVERVTDGAVTALELFPGLTARFQQLAEPESCIHPTIQGQFLWNGLDRQSGWLWNGLKGGLIVPACDMSVMGLSQTAFLEEWVAKGANRQQILDNRCWAYQLEGFYQFTETRNPDVQQQLREKVKLLAEDAPALQKSLHPDAPVQCLNLGEGYRQSHGSVRSVTPLVQSGKGLTRVPVVAVTLEDGRRVYLSQLLMQGRLIPTTDVVLPLHPQHPCYDPACEQMLLNLLREAVCRHGDED